MTEPQGVNPASAKAVASLRARLLGWILGPLLVVMALNAWLSYGNAVQAANEAYDRSLYLAARTLAEELAWQDGKLRLDVHKAAGYLFENHTGSRLFYKITTLEGLWMAGDATLPDVQAPAPLPVKYFALVKFDDGVLATQPVRLAQLIHVMGTQSMTPPILRITVAETMEARQQLIRHILLDTLGSQGLMLLAAAALVVWGVQRGMRPLESFRQQLVHKTGDDFSPIQAGDWPRELRPLMETLNGYLDRLGRLIEIRKRFLDNAAHQLRTPLTVLKTQLTLVQRSAEIEQVHTLVGAARQTTDDAVRLTEQLLALTRVEHAQEMHSPQTVDLIALARQVTQEHVLRAHQCGHDLGFETTVAQGQRCEVLGVALLLHEALSNLVDNAIHHCPAGAHITVRVGQHWAEVQDNGPGIALAHQAHVFERFYRAAAAGVSGSGLGLSIVQEIAKQHAVQLQLQSPVFASGGTIIRMAWPQLVAGPASKSGKHQ